MFENDFGSDFGTDYLEKILKNKVINFKLKLLLLPLDLGGCLLRHSLILCSGYCLNCYCQNNKDCATSIN